MRSNRRIATLGLDACIDSYYQYGIISDSPTTLSRTRVIEVENTTAMVYKGEGTNILVFRGSDDPMDWKENLDVFPSRIHRPRLYESISPFRPKVEAKVHGGFYGAYKRLQPALRDVVEDTELEGDRWLLTGHSLGGAVANIAALAMHWTRDPDVVTFGSPRWGNKTACWTVNQKTRGMLRFVNNNDIVPLLPCFLGPWTHSSPRIALRGDNTNPFSAHEVFDYRVGLNRYNG